MRTAVDKVGRGKERQVNARFSAMVSHFLFEAEFCNPASGWEKGQIEKNVQDAPSALAAHAQLPLPGGAKRLAREALPGDGVEGGEHAGRELVARCRKPPNPIWFSTAFSPRESPKWTPRRSPP
jgi:hypothetical protein